MTERQDRLSGKLGAILVEQGIISPDQLEVALREQARLGGKLGAILGDLGVTTEEEIASAIARQAGVGAYAVHEDEIDPEALDLVPESLARKHLLVPLRLEHNQLVVAMANPSDVVAIDELRRQADRFVTVVGAPEAQILRAQNAAYRRHTPSRLYRESGTTGIHEVIDRALNSVSGDPKGHRGTQEETESMLRTRVKSEAGFSLLELIVAMAILAILTAAIAPLVLQYVGDSRLTRAANDAEALATAIQHFNVDTATWPYSNDGDTTNANEVSRLVGQPAALVGTVPGACPAAPADAGNWDTLGAANALADFLIRNDVGGTPLYVPSVNPLVTPGWRGPYVPVVPLDPWGNPFVANVRHIDGAGIATLVEEQQNAVFVISAGPNLCFDTPVDDATSLASTGLLVDDIGSLVEGNIN